MIRILVICTGNAARSQIAEGLFRHLGGADLEVHSAGTHPAGIVHPYAIATMRERGIDISTQTSKPLSPFEGRTFDYVITVCDEASQECPHFTGARRQLHWSTPDPSLAAGTEDDRLDAFRATIVSLEGRIQHLIGEIRSNEVTPET